MYNSFPAFARWALAKIREPERKEESTLDDSTEEQVDPAAEQDEATKVKTRA